MLPRPRLRRAITAVVAAAALLAGVTACSAVESPAEAATRRSIDDRRLEANADSRFTSATVRDDVAARTLSVVPLHRNGGVVVFLHGWSQTRWSVLERPEEASVARRLVNAGYVLVSADAGGKAWGDAASVDDYERLIEATQRAYRLHDVFLMGESMGGLATMQLARRLDQVRAVVAWYPVCDLATIREPRFQASIRAAWPDGFAAVSPVPVGAAPMMVWASPEDTVVSARLNAARCVSEAAAAGARVSYTHTTGQHGSPSNFHPDEVLSFFDAHRTPGS